MKTQIDESKKVIFQKRFHFIVAFSRDFSWRKSESRLRQKNLVKTQVDEKKNF